MTNKHKLTLTITSLFSIVLFTVHLADDIVRGFEPGKTETVNGILIAVVYLFGTLVIAESRPGLAIMLLGAIGGFAVPIVHMTGAGLVGGRIANSSGMLFWVWTLLAMGATSGVAAILSAYGLWSSFRRRPLTVPEPRP